MSVAHPFVTQSGQSRSTWREKLRAWITLAILLGVLGIPMYGIYRLSEMYTFRPDLERAGGTVQLEVVGPQWLRDFAARP